jgi:hypothetical protein
MHGAPDDIARIILKKKMVNALVIYETIGIIGPFLPGREMQLRTEGFFVGRDRLLCRVTQRR